MLRDNIMSDRKSSPERNGHNVEKKSRVRGVTLPVLNWIQPIFHNQLTQLILTVGLQSWLTRKVSKLW